MGTTLCRDCVYCKPPRFLFSPWYEYAKCHHPKIGVRMRNLVNGEHIYRFCDHIRKQDQPDCPGFSPKLPLLQRIIPIRRLWRANDEDFFSNALNADRPTDGQVVEIKNKFNQKLLLLQKERLLKK